jgi:hypothetical protein
VPSNAPAGYDELVESNFIDGCTGVVPASDGSTTTLAAEDTCRCEFDVYRDEVPYDDSARVDERYADYPDESPTFRDLERSLGSDPATLDTVPQEVRDALAGCRAASLDVPGPIGTSAPLGPVGADGG